MKMLKSERSSLLMSLPSKLKISNNDEKKVRERIQYNQRAPSVNKSKYTKDRSHQVTENVYPDNLYCNNLRIDRLKVLIKSMRTNDSEVSNKEDLKYPIYNNTHDLSYKNQQSYNTSTSSESNTSLRISKNIQLQLSSDIEDFPVNSYIMPETVRKEKLAMIIQHLLETKNDIGELSKTDIVLSNRGFNEYGVTELEALNSRSNGLCVNFNLENSLKNTTLPLNVYATSKYFGSIRKQGLSQIISLNLDFNRLIKVKPHRIVNHFNYDLNDAIWLCLSSKNKIYENRGCKKYLKILDYESKVSEIGSESESVHINDIRSFRDIRLSTMNRRKYYVKRDNLLFGKRKDTLSYLKKKSTLHRDKKIVISLDFEDKFSIFENEGKIKWALTKLPNVDDVISWSSFGISVPFLKTKLFPSRTVPVKESKKNNIAESLIIRIYEGRLYCYIYQTNGKVKNIKHRFLKALFNKYKDEYFTMGNNNLVNEYFNENEKSISQNENLTWKSLNGFEEPVENKQNYLRNYGISIIEQVYGSRPTFKEKNRGAQEAVKQLISEYVSRTEDFLLQVKSNHNINDDTDKGEINIIEKSIKILTAESQSLANNFLLALSSAGLEDEDKSNTLIARNAVVQTE